MGVLPESFWAYRAALAYGVTTTHDPSATSWEVFTQAEMVESGEHDRATHLLDRQHPLRRRRPRRDPDESRSTTRATICAA